MALSLKNLLRLKPIPTTAILDSMIMYLIDWPLVLAIGMYMLNENCWFAIKMVDCSLKWCLVNKGDSRPATFRGKGVNTGLVRQTWGMSLFGPM